MYQEAATAQTTTCQYCQERPVEYQKWLACSRCYQRKRAAGRVISSPTKRIAKQDKARSIRGVCWGCRREVIDAHQIGRCGYCFRVARNGFVKHPHKSKPSLIYLGPLPHSPFLFKPHPSVRKTSCVHLMESKGVEVFNDFDFITHHPAHNLTTMAEKYGITRERMRQIYTKATGLRGNAVSSAKSKRIMRDIREMTCAQDPRHYIAMSPKDSHVYEGAIRELRFMEEAQRRGFSITPACDRSTDFVVNGWNLEVKGTKAAYKGKRNRVGYYRFAGTHKEYRTLDFVAAYHPTEMCWFIIPKRDISKSKHRFQIFISQYKTDYSFHGGKVSKNRYWEHRDAWHLLEAPCTPPT